MAVTVERLIATLEARFDKYERSLNRALGLTNRQFTAIERRGKAMEARMATIGAGVGRRFAAGLAAGLSVSAFQQLSDAATRIDNALKIAGLSGEELERVYGRLRDTAVKNAAPLEGLVELYSRLALVQKDLGKSSAEIVTFTEKVAVAMRVGGRPASETAGALLQLSQALGEGIVRSQEFNSLIEGAPALLQAAAAGIKEAEGSVAKLRKIMLDGRLSSKALFDGVIAGSSMLEEKVENAEYSISQSMGNLRTALLDAVREFNNETGAASSAAKGINNLAEAISDFDVSGFVRKVQEARDATRDFLTEIANSGLVERFAEAFTGLELTVGQPINLETVEAEQKIASLDREIELLQQQIANTTELGFDTTDAKSRLAELRAEVAALRIDAAMIGVIRTGSGFIGSPELPGNQPKRPAPAPIKPISIKDPRYRTEDDKKGKKKHENDYARETRQIQERTAALMAETAAMAGLNPLVDDYGYTLEKARATQELLTAAKRAGIAVTPELEASIEQLAEGYANATVEAAKLSEAQDKVRDRAEEMRSLGKDVLGGFIRDLRDGKSASEALANALGRVADKLLDIALEDLFSSKSGSGGGILSLLTGLFRERGGPVKKGQPYIVGEKRPELFVPDQDGHILPSVPEAPSPSSLASARSGAASYSAVYNIDARGAQRGVGEEVAAAIAAYDKGRQARLAADLPDLRRRMGAL